VKNKLLIKKIEPFLEATEIPMWGKIPDFPWEIFSEHLQKAFNLPEIELSCDEASWKSEEHFYEKMGPRPLIVSFEVNPLEGHVEWVMGWSDLSKLISLTLEKGEGGGFVDEDLQRGYYHFLLLQALAEVQKLSLFNDFSFRWQDKQIPIKEKAYVIDVRISIFEKSVYGRLLCSQAFHTSFSDHFKNRPLDLSSYAVSAEIFLPLSLHIGHVSLSAETLETIDVGDFILLDHCSYHPKEHKGIATLHLKQTSLMNGRIKEGSLKIIEIIPTQEAIMSEETEESEKEESAVLIKAEEIPLSIKVEIGTLSMSLEKLLLLQPGNILDLPSLPERGVQLTVNGKTIARGELIEMGEAVGVKITEINRG